jgi:hypothetical protein
MEASQLDMEKMPLSSGQMAHLLVITDEWLLALVASELERVLERFCGGAGRDGVEQAMKAAGKMAGATRTSDGAAGTLTG